MKNRLKIIIAVVVLLVFVVGGWLLYAFLGPQPQVVEVLPDKAIIYVNIKNPMQHLGQLRNSEIFKKISAIDKEEILRRNNVSSEKIEEYLKNENHLKSLLDNPLLVRLIGNQIAYAEYKAKDYVKGMVLVSRPDASFIVAQKLSGMFKELGEGINLSQENLNGQTLTHVSFKEKNMAFKYVYIKGFFILTVEDSPIMADIIATASHQHGALKNDQGYLATAVHFYPKSQATMYVNVNGAVRLAEDVLKAPSMANASGLKTYGFSFLPGKMQSYNFFATYDPAHVDDTLQSFIGCNTKVNGVSLIIPSAITYHWGGCYDFKAIAQPFKANAQALFQKQPKKIRKSLEKKLSSENIDKWLNALGNEAGFYVTDVDTQGMFPYPRFLLFASLKEPQALEELLDNLLSAPMIKAFIRNEEYQGGNIRYLALPLGGNMDPGFVIKDGFFLLATSRQLLKKSLDTHADSSKSILEDKNFKDVGFATGEKAKAIVFAKVNDMAKLGIGLWQWYDRYLTNQVEMAAAYKKEAEAKKITLANDLKNQKDELALAKIKLEEWKGKITPELLPEELESTQGAIANVQEQIKQMQQSIVDMNKDEADINKALKENAVQVEKNKVLMFNGSHIIVPILEGVKTLNVFGVKCFSTKDTVETEFMLN